MIFAGLFLRNDLHSRLLWRYSLASQPPKEQGEADEWGAKFFSENTDKAASKGHGLEKERPPRVRPLNVSVRSATSWGRRATIETICSRYHQSFRSHRKVIVSTLQKCVNLYDFFRRLWNTGWPKSKLLISNGCTSKIMHFWPYVVKAKMCLRGSSFFQFSEICLHFSAVCLQFFKKTTASQIHFGFTNMGSEMLSFRVMVIWNEKILIWVTLYFNFGIFTF